MKQDMTAPVHLILIIQRRIEGSVHLRQGMKETCKKREVQKVEDREGRNRRTFPQRFGSVPPFNLRPGLQ